ARAPHGRHREPTRRAERRTRDHRNVPAMEKPRNAPRPSRGLPRAPLASRGPRPLPPGAPAPPPLLSILAVLVLSRPALAAWSHDAITHVPVAPGISAEQTPSAAIPDGAGGVYVAWTDRRNGSDDIFLQRITATGNVSPRWR